MGYYAYLLLLTAGLWWLPARAEDPFSSFKPQVTVDSRFQNGIFIVPNEDEFYLFDGPLKGKSGALISVGTYRSLEAASRGDFTHLLMADVDPGIVRFNERQIEAFRRANTPKEFVAEILGERRFLTELPELEAPDFAMRWKEFRRREAAASAIRAEEELIPHRAAIFSLLEKDSPLTLEDTREIARLLGKPQLAEEILEKDFYKGVDLKGTPKDLILGNRLYILKQNVFKDAFSRAGLQARQIQTRYAYIDSLVEFLQRPVKDQKGFLADVEKFRRLKSMAMDGRMHSVQVNLAGQELADLGQTLKKAGIKVGVVDVSNAPDYFYNLPEPRAAFLRGLEAMPLTNDARLHFTTEIRFNGKPSDSWAYFSQGIEAFIDQGKETDALGRMIPFPLLLEREESLEGLLNPRKFGLGVGCPSGFDRLGK